MNLAWYRKNWRRLELLNGRSPKSGRPIRKGFTGEIETDYPTPEDWAALATYRKLTCKTRRVDHETAYLAAYGESDPQTIRMLDSFIQHGILVGDFPKHH